MALDADAVAWLRTTAGSAATHTASEGLSARDPTLRLVDRLRRTYTPEQARWAIDLAEGRRVASSKFGDAQRLFFDRESAEQATSEVVALHTAARFVGANRIADLGCGAGADGLALARHAPVLAVDLDAGRAALTGANASVRQLPIETRVADLREVDLAGVDAGWLDPARRDASGRVLDPERWQPPLSQALHIVRGVARGGIKVAPGIDLTAVPTDAEVEFISLEGRLVEAVVWLGDAVSAVRRATVLPTGATLAGEPDGDVIPLGDPESYLYDLDPAVGRAGLVGALAADLGAHGLSEGVAYLSSTTRRDSPFARRFRVLEWLPFSERQLLEACRSAGAVRVEVMRRASPVETNDLEGRLNRGLPGGAGRVLTVALTRVRDRHVALVCERDEVAQRA